MVLRMNSRGEAVSDLQRRLNQLGYKLAVDGIFGSLTQRAVIDFQRKNRLVADGIVGILTRTRLVSQTSSPAAAGLATVTSSVPPRTAPRPVVAPQVPIAPPKPSPVPETTFNVVQSEGSETKKPGLSPVLLAAGGLGLWFLFS